eukprot:Amastigsp_a348319_22.p4 type:complete len:162 gc:universal Amastigsp_a348319_22:1371-886(-)
MPHAILLCRLLQVAFGKCSVRRPSRGRGVCVSASRSGCGGRAREASGRRRAPAAECRTTRRPCIVQGAALEGCRPSPARAHRRHRLGGRPRGCSQRSSSGQPRLCRLCRFYADDDRGSGLGTGLRRLLRLFALAWQDPSVIWTSCRYWAAFTLRGRTSPGA